MAPLFPNPNPNLAIRALLDPSPPSIGAKPLSLGGALPMHCTASASPDGRLLRLRLEALVPTVELHAVSLYALRVHPTALSEALQQPAARRRPSSGYLTMEQTRKLLLLAETDPKAFDVPLVGVWVAGVPDAQHPYVWAVCARFAALPSDVAQRVSVGQDHACLLLVYDAPPEATRMPICGSNATNMPLGGACCP